MLEFVIAENHFVNSSMAKQFTSQCSFSWLDLYRESFGSTLEIWKKMAWQEASISHLLSMHWMASNVEVRNHISFPLSSKQIVSSGVEASYVLYNTSFWETSLAIY